ncbi:NAD-dependent succinate-semialdehyde dehydrogenase [Motilimonas sp. 1_MG-2023]|uniref:NAD-dependent succinate-semialdehyde dehydrogenase n=1 Tax=Motilimonas TaxID=1914248 RepID=UPI0026E180B0|nr:NAD-dependent succinate-semialdehyde dehydrogenase [Motilimonas sp. 1_MG-2023]MDO6524415.1 NAD-dependent succinate-semialdehyde dehydrogenase [Motilimonas sp. 1_MG-2023]
MNFLQLNDNQLIKQANYLNGRWQVSNKSITVSNPANGVELGTIPVIDKLALEQTITAAQEAFDTYSKTNSYKRSEWLLKWYDLILSAQDDLAKILTQEQGKPLAEAKGEILYAASFIKWFAEQINADYGLTLNSPVDNKQFHTHKQAIGVAALITPWNFPAAMITRKAAAALAAGCSIIIKPSELTPFTAIALVELAHRAGFPKGVINLVTGNAPMIGDALCHDQRVKKLSFTGSTPVGQKLFAQSATSLKRLSLELGGNAPFIIFADADLDAAVDALMISKFRNNGQTCVAANRIYVAQNLQQAFLTKLKAKLPSLTVGNGMDKNVQLGPLINQAAVDKVHDLVASAISAGAKLEYQADLNESNSPFFPVTLLVDITPNMPIAQKEIFGPVLAVQWFDEETEVITRANSTDAGLAAYFFSDNIHRCQRVAGALDYGMIGINDGMVSNAVSPFGGIKQSGLGREGGHTGLAEYQYIKAHCYGQLS